MGVILPCSVGDTSDHFSLDMFADKYRVTVMKYVLLLLYANLETSIVDDEGIEHMEGYVGGPKSGKLMVRVTAATWPNAER